MSRWGIRSSRLARHLRRWVGRCHRTIIRHNRRSSRRPKTTPRHIGRTCTRRWVPIILSDSLVWGFGFSFSSGVLSFVRCGSLYLRSSFFSLFLFVAVVLFVSASVVVIASLCMMSYPYCTLCSVYRTKREGTLWSCEISVVGHV